MSSPSLFFFLLQQLTLFVKYCICLFFIYSTVYNQTLTIIFIKQSVQFCVYLKSSSLGVVVKLTSLIMRLKEVNSFSRRATNKLKKVCEIKCEWSEFGQVPLSLSGRTLRESVSCVLVNIVAQFKTLVIACNSFYCFDWCVSFVEFPSAFCFRLWENPIPTDINLKQCKQKIS